MANRRSVLGAAEGGKRRLDYDRRMCRNIRPLFNFEPPASQAEVEDAALQFVRKISGSHHPSRANQAAFDRAVAEITRSCRRLLESMVTSAPPRDRETEAAKAKARAQRRFA